MSKGGKRIGAGRKPALSVGERKHFYLAPDLVQWWNTLPERGRSEVVNRALRDVEENGKLLDLIWDLISNMPNWEAGTRPLLSRAVDTAYEKVNGAGRKLMEDARRKNV